MQRFGQQGSTQAPGDGDGVAPRQPPEDRFGSAAFYCYANNFAAFIFAGACENFRKIMGRRLQTARRLQLAPKLSI